MIWYYKYVYDVLRHALNYLLISDRYYRAIRHLIKELDPNISITSINQLLEKDIAWNIFQYSVTSNQGHKPITYNRLYFIPD